MVVHVRSATQQRGAARQEGGGIEVQKHGTIYNTNVWRAVTRGAYQSLDKVVRLSEVRSACETRLWELEQQFEVKAAKVREEYLAAVLEIHVSEAKGNQRAHHS